MPRHARPPARRARLAEIPVGGGRVFPERRVVVTQPTAGEFRGFGIVCTHDGCELNAVADGTINCPCHGSRYAITDGSVVQGPARTGLRVEQVAVDGDQRRPALTPHTDLRDPAHRAEPVRGVPFQCAEAAPTGTAP